MLLKKLNLYIIIIASTMVCVLGFIYDYSLARLAYTLLVVLIVFYILTNILQRIINKNIDEAKQKSLESEHIEAKDSEADYIEDEDEETHIEGDSVSQKKTDINT